MKILVVDDHPLIQEALRRVLTELDPALRLVEARDAAQAATQVQTNADIDLVLLDLTLPGKHGLDLLAELREHHAEIPVVVLSAHEDRDTVLRSIDRGAMGFIPKTSKTEVLLAALRLVLSGGVYLPPAAFHTGTDLAPPALPPSDQLRLPAEIGLTTRQIEVLSLLVQGKPNKLICRELDLAEGTVKIHVTAILRALGVSSRTEAVVAVGRMGLRLDGFSRPRPAGGG